MSTFGKTTDGANSSNWTIDRCVLSSASCSATETLQKLTARIWVDGGSSKVKGVVYADNAGSPSALLATGDEVTITNTSEAAVDLPFSGVNQITVTSGVTYWIGYHNEDPGANNFFQSRAATGGAQLRASDAYADGPNNPWVLTGSADGPIDCYATSAVTSVLKDILGQGIIAYPR